MYNVCHNIYRNFLPNWIAQISVGFTLMGVFKILFQKMPWKQWWFQQKAEPEREALLAEVRDEAIVCERQTQLMRLIKNWSASDIGTVCRTLQWLLYNERWHELSWAVIVVCSFNQTGYIHSVYYTLVQCPAPGMCACVCMIQQCHPLSAVFVLMRSLQLPPCNDMNIQCWPSRAVLVNISPIFLNEKLIDLNSHPAGRINAITKPSLIWICYRITTICYLITITIVFSSKPSSTWYCELCDQFFFCGEMRKVLPALW